MQTNVDRLRQKFEEAEEAGRPINVPINVDIEYLMNLRRGLSEDEAVEVLAGQVLELVVSAESMARFRAEQTQ